MPVPSQAWKDYERRVAKSLGGRRIPVTGERDGADVVVDGFSTVQVKLRRGDAPPAYVVSWLKGIRDAANRRNEDPSLNTSGEIGIVVWKKTGADDKDAVVVLSMEDWAALHGGGM
jgi:hypothetical protein